METVTLSGAEIIDKAALHAALAARLGFPDWYGANLDALHDLLTEWQTPRRFVLRNCRTLRARLGDGYYFAFLRVLRDSGAELELWDD